MIPYASLVVPVHNEAELLKANTLALRDYLETHFNEYEIILVENGSVDGTYVIAHGLESLDVVRVVELPEPCLAEALKAGNIAAAGLDVYEKEPEILPVLLECENAVLVPHIGSASRETRAKMAKMAAGNIVEMLTGGTPPNCVNPEVL